MVTDARVAMALLTMSRFGKWNSGSWAQQLTALLLVLVWAACFVIIKAGLSEAPPLFTSALRSLVAAAPLVMVSVMLGRLAAPKDAWGWLVLLGLASTALALGSMYLAVRHAGAAIPSVLANTQALLVAPFAARFFGEPLTREKIVALLLGFGGVALTIVPGSRGLGSLEGAIFALLASAGIAVGTLVQRKIGGKADFVTATTWQYIIGTFPLLAAALLTEEIAGMPWSPAFVAGVLFLGLAGSAGASLVWFLLVQRTELVRLTSFTLLTPVFGLLLSTLLFREPVGPLNWIGLVLTIAGVAWLQLSADQTTAGREVVSQVFRRLE